MTRRVSKHGTAYTEGSHSTPAEGYPRECDRCGQRVFTSRQSFSQHYDGLTGERTIRHLLACPPAPR